MLFNNPQFFVFVGICIVLLSFGPRTYKKCILLLSSYVFYGLWDWRFLSLIWISTIVDYTIGRELFVTPDVNKKKKLLFISVFTNLSLLGLFKYFNFFIDSLIDLLGIGGYTRTLNIILPVGISFYTFQTMSYTIDIYRRQFKPTNSLLDFSNFVAFFPQLVAGPIERAKNLLPQIEKFNGISIKHIRSAIVLIFLGYTKKVLISDNIAPVVDNYFENFIQLDSIYAVSGLILFSFQIYFDFSGYSDIARGLAKLFGIDLMINFNQPYFSVSLSDFWQRWHISLSTWLRDYLYIPLGGNRNGNFRRNISLMTTMLLGGLWHGASWNFVLWGGLHGFYLMMYKLFPQKKHLAKKNLFTYLNRLIKIILVYILVSIAWLPFRTQDYTTTWAFINHIIFWSGSVDVGELIFIVFILFVFVIIDLPAYITKDHLYLLRLPKWLLSAILLIGTIGITITMFTYQETVRPFIYFQF